MLSLECGNRLEFGRHQAAELRQISLVEGRGRQVLKHPPESALKRTVPWRVIQTAKDTVSSNVDSRRGRSRVHKNLLLDTTLVRQLRQAKIENGREWQRMAPKIEL